MSYPEVFEPTKQNKIPEWATYIASRRPQFKIHTRRNHAVNALNCHYDGALYYFEDGAWKLIDQVDPEVVNTCIDCGIKRGQPYPEDRVPATKWGPRTCYTLTPIKEKNVSQYKQLRLCTACRTDRRIERAASL